MTDRERFEAWYCEFTNANPDILEKNRTGDTYFDGFKLDKINVAYAAWRAAQEQING